MEGRAAPVARTCVGGSNAGSLCNENADCPSSSCTPTNVFNISVAIHFNATAAQLTSIRNLITNASARLFDYTDGQARIGQATLHNNAFSSTGADFRVFPASSPVWWVSDTGGWRVGGNTRVSIDNVTLGGAVGSYTHELIHLLFDPRDEYEMRPACGAVGPNDTCPVQATINAGQAACVMDNSANSELCWGQGNAADATDVSAGNHDADNTTEQSACRSNRSCWAQVVWSWPNTILPPAGAPDPDANGLTATPPSFLVVDNTARGVLVLDESGSMAIDSPSRMARLKVAAKDFIALAETGTELGLVSFASDAATASGRSRIAVAALGADRSALNNEVDSLGPSTATNIGAGLQVAQTLINDAGGVTGNTFIVLMTDGLNNQPGTAAEAQADLQSRIDALLAAGIEVYVTCTGSDLGLQSQCAEIAAGTGGFFVDSASPEQLPESFAEIAARASGHELIRAQSTTRMALRPASFKSRNTQRLAERFLKTVMPAERDRHVFFVEKGSESALFTLQWTNEQGSLKAVLISPSGDTHDMLPMPQGAFRQILKPESGDWTIRVASSFEPGEYVAKGYSRNPTVNVGGGVRHPSVEPGQDLYVYAYPRGDGRTLSHGGEIPMLVTRPDGSNDVVILHDRGRDHFGTGDDVPGDGTFTGVYRDTQMKGAYQFASLWSVQDWPEAEDARSHQRVAKQTIDDFRSARFERELRFSAAVADPRDIERTPDDTSVKGNDPNQRCKDQQTSGSTGGDRRDKPPVPVVFELQNATGKDLFFTNAPESKTLAFDITTADRQQKIAVPENAYCEPLCPQSGLPREIDCEKPRRVTQRVRPAGRIRTTWSGLESLSIQRDCDGRRAHCRENVPPKPGKYTVNVCASTEENGGQQSCQQVSFDYPAKDPVVIRFKR